MLEKCENLQNTIKDQENTAKEEKASIDELLAERASKQQEVQNLVSTTSDNISSYVNQISASQDEASALMAQVNSADSSISQLMEQAEQERAAEEATVLRKRQQLQKKFLQTIAALNLLMRRRIHPAQKTAALQMIHLRILHLLRTHLQTVLTAVLPIPVLPARENTLETLC